MHALAPRTTRVAHGPAAVPLVSIVIAAHRTPRELLRVAVVSALAQDWPALEVLVSDDSPDDSLRAQVERLRDPRVRYRHNRPALGVAENHWALFNWARGEYIAILNHDDWLDPIFVSTLARRLMVEPELVLAFCDHWIIDGAGRRLVAETERNSETWSRDRLPPGLQHDAPLLVARQSLPIAMGTLFRRSALPDTWPADVGPAYDLWLSYVLLRGGGRAWFEPGRLSAWRSHEGNLTSASGMAWLRGTARCWDAVIADGRFASVHDIARERSAAAHYACAMRSWAGGSGSEARRFAARSLRSRPGWRGLAVWLASLLPARLAPQRWRHRPLALTSEPQG